MISLQKLRVSTYAISKHNVKNVGTYGYGYVKKKCNPVPLCDQNVKNGKGIREHTHCNNDHNDDVIYRIIMNIYLLFHTLIIYIHI